MPPQGQGKSLKHYALAEDGFDYAVKTLKDHPMIPVSEWFCYQIAQSVALSCPNCVVLKMHDGSRAFGSRIETGLSLMKDAIAGTDPADYLASCADRMCVAYAMDLFVANIDRHFGNFLFGTNGLGLRTVMPIDYGHAWRVGGWPLKDIINKSCPTTNHIEILRGMGLWRPSSALTALGTISQIPADRIELWLSDVPSSWLASAQRAETIEWWSGDDFHSRVSKCVKHCKP